MPPPCRSGSASTSTPPPVCRSERAGAGQQGRVVGQHASYMHAPARPSVPPRVSGAAPGVSPSAAWLRPVHSPRALSRAPPPPRESPGRSTQAVGWPGGRQRARHRPCGAAACRRPLVWRPRRSVRRAGCGAAGPGCGAACSRRAVPPRLHTSAPTPLLFRCAVPPADARAAPVTVARSRGRAVARLCGHARPRVRTRTRHRVLPRACSTGTRCPPSPCAAAGINTVSPPLCVPGQAGPRAWRQAP